METIELTYDKTPISQLEFKPVIKLAKISQKHGFEDWLKHEQVEVKDIWGFYIYNDSVLTYCCEIVGSYWLECLGYWFDEVASVGKVLNENYLTETDGGVDLALRQWLEDELSPIPTHEDRFYTHDISRSIVLLDTTGDNWIGLASEHVLANVDPDDDPTYEDLQKLVEEWFYEIPCNGGKDEWLELFNQKQGQE